MAKFYKVGGCIRDKLLGRPCRDIDYSVEAKAYNEMVSEISARGMKIVYEMEPYLTVKASCKGIVSDYVMCRKDGPYRDNRRPSEVQCGTLFDDLSRRDFTMNAIAEDENGHLIDPFGGVNDIRNKIIRCVGSVDRLKEDALRLLRAIRFLITLSDFSLNKEIEDALHDPTFIDLLKNISEDRQRDELEKCFKHDTLKTLYILYKYPLIIQHIFNNTNLWLKPTSEKIKKI